MVTGLWMWPKVLSFHWPECGFPQREGDPSSRPWERQPQIEHSVCPGEDRGAR